jgi:hypothetical protein
LVVFSDPEFTGEMFDNDNQFGLKTVTVVAFLMRVQCTVKTT